MMHIPPPDTEHVRQSFAEDHYGHYSQFHAQQFDAWLNKIKAEVWDQGQEAYGSMENPYRTDD